MILAIDTSGAVSAAVVAGEEILASRMDARARHHDEVLLQMIDQVLTDAGITRGDLTGVVVGRGPGPFTGLRVGLVTARSIAAMLRLPLHGLSSLDGLALQAHRQHPEARSIGVALDARRSEVYWATYRAGEQLSTVDEPAVSAPGVAAASLNGCDVLVGAGAHLWPELTPTGDLQHVDAGHLALAAAVQQAAGADLSSTEPMYLRAPDAKKPTGRKSALGAHSARS